ncbi:MAG: hypothetical protein HY921_12505 [Elusimicrobia bacterium]|nr:hypothetical protein [Elusimicrobiota bacterium]
MRTLAGVLAICMALSPALALAEPAPRAPAPSADALQAAREQSGLDARTPRWLPPGYGFEGFAVLPQGRKKVVHWRYSDGTRALSLFQGPARVRWQFGARPAQRTKLGRGWALWVSTPEGVMLSWSLPKARFFLIGSPPLETLKKVALSIE